MALQLLRRRIGIVLAIGTAAVGACRNDGSGTQQKVAALTPTAGASAAAGDQALADAYARQAAIYAQIAAGDRAEAAAVSAAITTEQTQLAAAVAAKAASPAAAVSGTAATALATPGTSGASSTPTVAGVPATAAKFEDSRQKAAALADQLGANAQALATFHLARVNQLSGVAAEGGAQ
jgi:hypothetical protein